jgi:hypothetical protein
MVVSQTFLFAMVSASANLGNHSFKAGYFPDNVELRKFYAMPILFESSLTLGSAAKVPDVNDFNIPAVYYRELRGLDGHPARFLPVNSTRARQANVLQIDFMF